MIRKTVCTSKEKTGKRSLRFLTREEGATAVEYAIISSLIAGVVGLTVSQPGIKVRDLFVINGW